MKVRVTNLSSSPEKRNFYFYITILYSISYPYMNNVLCTCIMYGYV